MKLSSGLFLVTVCAALLVSSWVQGEPLPKQPPTPKDNPQTPAKIELGKQLYFDPRLSRTGTVSCNSCHGVEGSGTDNLSTSFGVEGKRGGRGAPTVWNSAYMSVLFWDGRAASLEEQAKGPLVNPVEMGMPNLDAVVARVNAIPGYQEQFKKVFGNQGLNIDNIAKAIASFERTLVTPNSAYDRYMRGDKKALSASAKRGMETIEKVGCVTCHMGPNFAGPELDPGLGFYQKLPQHPGSEYDKKYDLLSDLGRHQVTKDENDKNMWRVPTWRNIALTAPYFHNGKVKTLDEAVRVMAKVQLGVTLTETQVTDIVAFLNSLTGEFPKIQLPRLPPYANASLMEPAAQSLPQ